MSIYIFVVYITDLSIAGATNEPTLSEACQWTFPPSALIANDASLQLPTVGTTSNPPNPPQKLPFSARFAMCRTKTRNIYPVTLLEMFLRLLD